MYQHILLATDLGDTSGQVAKTAYEMTAAFHAKLSIVHAIEPIPAYGYPDLSALESPIIEQAKQEMKKLREKLKITDADCYIEFGPVKIEILKIARQTGADLIIIGSHGRHGLSRLLGSGAQSIINSAECDVHIKRIKE